MPPVKFDISSISSAASSKIKTEGKFYIIERLEEGEKSTTKDINKIRANNQRRGTAGDINCNCAIGPHDSWVMLFQLVRNIARNSGTLLTNFKHVEINCKSSRGSRPLNEIRNPD